MNPRYALTTALTLLICAWLGSAAAQTPAQYTCPMHPHYISTDANGTCPICGMDLVPVAGNKTEKGSASIAVASGMLQTMGVRTARVAIATFGRRVRAYGNVEPNTRLETVVASRLEGWIESLTVRAEGDSVRPGALLYRIYSPDLIAAQKDYLLAVQAGNPKRLGAVRQRLRSLGLQPAVIARLENRREVTERIPVYAEAGGIVLELLAREGAYLKPGTPVLRLQSYAKVWVIASIAEQDLALVDTGMPVTLGFPSAPAAPAAGRVDYVYPTIDPRTRTARVRIEVDNAAGHLRPGAYADISFDLGGDERLAVPTEAILRDSRGAHVVMALGGGRFAGRAVRTGIAASGRTEILSGLSVGEEIVISGQFLLDSEVNLREGLARLAPQPTADTPLAELQLDAATLAQFDHLVDTALYLHEALIDNYAIDPYYLDPTLTLAGQLETRFAETRLAPVIKASARAITAARDARQGAPLAIQLQELVAALLPWLSAGAEGHYAQQDLVLFRDTASGAHWLQQGGAARNPYGAGVAERIDWPAAQPVPPAPRRADQTTDHSAHGGVR